MTAAELADEPGSKVGRADRARRAARAQRATFRLGGWQAFIHCRAFLRIIMMGNGVESLL